MSPRGARGLDRAPSRGWDSTGLSTLPFSPLIRKAGLEDLPELLGVINRAYDRERWLFPHPRINLSELLAELRVPARVFLVAESDGLRVGTVRVDLGSPPGAKATPLFGLLAVDPAYQGFRLGDALIRTVEARVLRSGFGELFLDCIEEMGLPAYYARLGYAEVGRTFGERWGSTGPFTLVRMRKGLRYRDAMGREGSQGKARLPGDGCQSPSHGNPPSFKEVR